MVCRRRAPPAFAPCSPRILPTQPRPPVCPQARPSLLCAPRAALAAGGGAGSAAPTRVLIVGGTGRVGAATARALAALDGPPVSLTLAGRRIPRGERLARDVQARAGAHVASVRFAQLELADAARLAALVASHDVVLHVAGPFQQRAAPNEVLRAALAAGDVDYLDVCDDVAHAADARALRARARAAGVRALVCTGIYPGVSNLAAAAAVNALDGPPQSIRMFYYTAGSGGIGASVLASTFLILAEPAVTFARGHGRMLRPAATAPEVFDFGGRVGPRTVYLLNLPEVSSLHETFLADGETWAKFSTGPPMWNWLLQGMARFGPKGAMRNKKAMQGFANFSFPVVRFVDTFVGARTAFVVHVVGAGDGDGANREVRLAYEHRSLEASVGEATGAFVAEVVRDRRRAVRQIAPGVHYPEELPAGVRARICADGVRGADRYGME